MTPYYPVRDGHPSMFAPEDNAGVVSDEQTFSISLMSGTAYGVKDAARAIHNASTDDAPRAKGKVNGVYAGAARLTPPACTR
jgi:hypothetical protein